MFQLFNSCYPPPISAYQLPINKAVIGRCKVQCVAYPSVCAFRIMPGVRPHVQSDLLNLTRAMQPDDEAPLVFAEQLRVVLDIAIYHAIVFTVSLVAYLYKALCKKSNGDGWRATPGSVPSHVINRSCPITGTINGTYGTLPISGTADENGATPAMNIPSTRTRLPCAMTTDQRPMSESECSMLITP